MEINGKEFYIKMKVKKPFPDIHGVGDFGNGEGWIDLECHSWAKARKEAIRYVNALCKKRQKETGWGYVAYLCNTDEWVENYPYPKILQPGVECPIKWKTLSFNYGRGASTVGEGSVFLVYKEFCYGMTKQEAQDYRVQ